MESQLCCAEHTSKRPHFQTVGQKQVYSQTIFYTEEDSQLYTTGTLVGVNSLSQSISILTTVLAGDIATGASIACRRSLRGPSPEGTDAGAGLGWRDSWISSS
jgi:hypothetical protein